MSETPYQKRIRFLAETTARDPKVVSSILESYLQKNQEALLKNGSLNISELGVFKIVSSESERKLSENGDIIDLPAQTQIRYSPSKNTARKLHTLKLENHPLTIPLIEKEIEPTQIASQVLTESLSSSEQVVSEPPVDDSSEPPTVITSFNTQKTDGENNPTEQSSATSQPEMSAQEDDSHALVPFQKKDGNKIKDETLALFFLGAVLLTSLAGFVIYQLSEHIQREVTVRDVFVTNENTNIEAKFTWNDNLKTIATQYYGDADKWPYLYFENLETIVSPERIFPGKDRVWVKYQTNADLAELYFHLYLYQSNVSPQTKMEYLSAVYRLKPLRVKHIQDKLSAEEKQTLGL